ncbi:helix-turn-helix domain-containing protein [Iamia sp.]|uniref:TetR/AcrR family transcriptional regulator n=1 Tax=Iamia sp. TaxID=2722710 RepID=UPI002BBD8358|nr:helix-turn-helix domain-containing protein [Iamia sp.]HXH59150.1 helix-turn-helix domain-containing protein [Iamia sp.]
MRRVPQIRLGPLVGAVAGPELAPDPTDDITEAILDAAASVLLSGGLRHCTVEAIAEHGRMGRTTIYRRFDGRDDLIHAVLAREVRRMFAAIAAAVGHLERHEDRIIEGLLAGLRAVESSPLAPLVRSEPELLRLLSVEAGALINVAVTFLVEEDRRANGREPTDRARHTAELLVRFAATLVTTPQSTLPLHDDELARRALHDLLDPLLVPFL